MTLKVYRSEDAPISTVAVVDTAGVHTVNGIRPFQIGLCVLDARTSRIRKAYSARVASNRITTCISDENGEWGAVPPREPDHPACGLVEIKKKIREQLDENNGILAVYDPEFDLSVFPSLSEAKRVLDIGAWATEYIRFNFDGDTFSSVSRDGRVPFHLAYSLIMDIPPTYVATISDKCPGIGKAFDCALLLDRLIALPVPSSIVAPEFCKRTEGMVSGIESAKTKRGKVVTFKVKDKRKPKGGKRDSEFPRTVRMPMRMVHTPCDLEKVFVPENEPDVEYEDNTDYDNIQ